MSDLKHVRSFRVIRQLALILVVLLASSLGGVAYAGQSHGQGVPDLLTPGRVSAQGGTLNQLVAEMEAAWVRQDWPEVLRLIDLIIVIDPNYPGIQDRKYHAHISYGYQLLTDGQCAASLHQFQSALMIRPAGQEALVGLELLSRYCPAPAPTPIPPIPPTPVPWPTPVPTYCPPVVPPAPPHPAPVSHIVQTGDTLYSIARRYGTTVEAIMAANGLVTYSIRIGEVLWIPAGIVLPGPTAHIVQPGETLFSIARKYNTTVWAIMSMNNLKTTTIFAYSVLYIPSAVHVGPMIHIVQPGETMYSIAHRYQVTVAVILQANNLTTVNIFVYQRLIIPPVGWAGTPPLVVVPHVPAPSRVHVVKPGDTLFSIARIYGTTVQAIMQCNGLTSSNIRVGQTLKIP
jgi:LysM repeat protein